MCSFARGRSCTTHHKHNCLHCESRLGMARYREILSFEKATDLPLCLVHSYKPPIVQTFLESLNLIGNMKLVEVQYLVKQAYVFTSYTQKLLLRYKAKE